MIRLMTVLAAVVVLALAASCAKDDSAPARAIGQGPVPAALGLDDDNRMHPGDADRCPVCAMTTVDKKMVSAIELDDGRTYYFCGTGCMMKSSLHPEIYLGAGDAQVKRAVTTGYFTGAPLDAYTATWVAGSDVAGPMGPMIVPLSNPNSVTDFITRHGGKTTFVLKDLNDALWEEITGKKAIPDAKP